MRWMTLALVGSPHLQKPELLSPSGISSPSTEEDPLERPDVAITRVVAAWIGVYLYRLLQSRDLDRQATRINLRTGQVNSTPIFGGHVVLPDGPGVEFLPDVLNDQELRPTKVLAQLEMQ
jgi:hypothetical protein